MTNYLDMPDTICQIVKRNGEEVRIISPIEPKPKKPRRLRPTEERAIRALLTQRTIADAARQARVSERSMYRWLKDDRFREELRQAHREALNHTAGRLQQISQDAVQALHAVINQANAPAFSRAYAARIAIEFGFKAAGYTDVVERLDALEACDAKRNK